VVGLVVVGAAAAMNRHAAVAPSNSSLPAISGTLAPGSTVSASPGTWSGSAPISYQYQWRICGADGNACHDIAGATGQTFQVRDQDPGNTLRVHVIASNADGSSADTSEPSGKISGSAPVPANTSPPTLGGNAAVGSTVTANTGTWSGSAPIGFQYQWQICGSNGSACHDIAGATAQSYQPKSGDQGNTLRVKVTASNSHGSSATTSDPTGTISAAPPAPAPAPNGCPRVTAGAQAVSVNDVSAPARLQVDQFQLVTGRSREACPRSRPAST
jgi:uncharacterized protein YukE